MEDWFRSIKKDISFVLSWISVRSELSLSPFDSALSASPGCNTKPRDRGISCIFYSSSFF
jgi:hypothetical protein